MNGQILQTTDAAPTIEVQFFSSATATAGKAVTTLTNVTAGFTLGFRRGNVTTNITLAAQTPTGAWVAGGFCHLANGTYRLDLPTTANAAGVTDFTLVGVLLPADVEMNSFVVALTPDDLTVAGPTAATIAALVWTAGTRELTGIATSLRESFADTLLGRTISGGANGGRDVRSVFRAIRNRVFRSGATLTITQEDDATAAWTASLTTDSAAAPITGIDPS